MATYKLIQDIEAEDKILGPLTLRQFVFALITVFLLYINFICVARGLPFLVVVFLPPALLTGFFAFPFGRDQPTEVWALGKLRFWFKPRQRIWNQSGVKDLVTITVPKKIVHVYTNGLSQTEVQSRLKTLANTIDSRGWAVKNVNADSFVVSPSGGGSSDRLLDIGSAPQAVPDNPVLASDDILDERNNPIAQQFDSMINQSNQTHRQALVDKMNNPAAPAVTTAADAPWFMPPTAGPAVPVVGAETPDEAALAAQLHAKHDARPEAYGNLRTIQPLGSQPLPIPIVQPLAPVAAVTATADPAMLALANNDDLNVATIAREAQKTKAGEPGSGEVVISLH